ncbi:MAG: NAD(P)/FAD-dependent oxidoreductase [Betaproteobacteria bacterium]|jgi:sulfite dehydrogenase|nr:NAD(P)/FAD-dependent oxidoreductase [Betaproteobacteria bacterium]
MSPDFDRRDFIRLVGAGAAATLAGCVMGPPKPVGRVIVIGGGFGGATVSKYLRMWSEGAIQVFMIEREAKFVSCPLSNLILGGSRNIAQNTFGYERLQKNHGVAVVQGEIAEIDTAKRVVKFKSNKYGNLTYDRVVLAPGIDFLYDQIPGLNTPEAQRRVPHAWKAGEQTVALRNQLEAMQDGGVFVFSIPKAPYRCPPGPYERVCQVADYFKRAKPRSKVVVLDANPQITSKGKLFQAAWDTLYKGYIDYQPNQEAKDVDLRTMTVKTEFDSIKGDVLNVVPPQTAGAIAHAAGVVTANNRWCEVNWLTAESTVVPNVHVIGDATQSAPGMPKSGSMANQQGKLAAAAIVALTTGKPVNQTPMINNTCYSYVSATEAMHVTSVHHWDAAKKTLLPVFGAGGVSPSSSALEKQFADGWALNIWNDALG